MRRGLPAQIVIVLASVTVSLLIGLGYLISARPEFVATAIIFPATDVEARPQSAIGGLALLDAARSPPTPFEKFLAVMRTPRFVMELDKRLDLAHRMFAGAWDPEHARWRAPGGFGALAARFSGVTAPTFDPVRALIEIFAAHLSVAETDKRDSITTLSFSWPDRSLADATLNACLETARALLIDQQTTLLSDEINYLETQLQTVQLAEHRSELARLLADRERQMMLLKAGDYGAETLQPVYTPPEPSRPSIRLTLLLSVCGGLALGVAIICFRVLRTLPPDA